MSDSRSLAVTELAPDGTLKAAINYGNPILAQRNAVTGELGGVSVALARELAKRLNIPLQLTPFDAAGKAFRAISSGACDVGFLAIDPIRGTEIDYTSPYVFIEGAYLARADSAFRHVDDVDRPGVRIAVGRNTAYELFLRRELKHAELVYSVKSTDAVELFLNAEADVAAGIFEPLRDVATAQSDVRLVDGRFMRIEQAMALPKGRESALAFLRQFVEEAKASGFIRAALDASGQAQVTIAPAR